MSFTNWDTKRVYADIKFNNVPYVAICRLNNYETGKISTYPLLGYGDVKESQRIGSIVRYSGTITTNYSTITPIITVGRLKDGSTRTLMYVPLEDSQLWKVYLKLSDDVSSPNVDYGQLINAINSNQIPLESITNG